MAIAVSMPETPEELRTFIREELTQQVVALQRTTLEEVQRLGEATRGSKSASTS